MFHESEAATSLREPPLACLLYADASARNDGCRLCAVQERERDGSRHAGSRPRIGILARQRSFQQTTPLLLLLSCCCCCCCSRVLCSLRHVINHPVCACVSVCARMCVRACTTFPRTSKRFRGKWRHKFKFGVSFVRFCYCNGHSPQSLRALRRSRRCDKTNQFKAAAAESAAKRRSGEESAAETAAELKSLISEPSAAATDTKANE